MKPSVRKELVKILLDEADYFGRPAIYHPGRCHWLQAVAESMTEHECFDGPPLDLQADTTRGELVLWRWRRMYGRIIRARVRRSMSEQRALT